jgi:hypothetical protein
MVSTSEEHEVHNVHIGVAARETVSNLKIEEASSYQTLVTT